MGKLITAHARKNKRTARTLTNARKEVNNRGFRPKLSTEVALAHFTGRVLERLDNGMLTGAVFLDPFKAFDTVDHSLLLTKLKQIGASDNATGWFRSYLSNRFQLTAVGDVQSTLRPH